MAVRDRVKALEQMSPSQEATSVTPKRPQATTPSAPRTPAPRFVVTAAPTAIVEEPSPVTSYNVQIRSTNWQVSRPVEARPLVKLELGAHTASAPLNQSGEKDSSGSGRSQSSSTASSSGSPPSSTSSPSESRAGPSVALNLASVSAGNSSDPAPHNYFVAAQAVFSPRGEKPPARSTFSPAPISPRSSSKILTPSTPNPPIVSSTPALRDGHRRRASSISMEKLVFVTLPNSNFFSLPFNPFSTPQSLYEVAKKHFPGLPHNVLAKDSTGTPLPMNEKLCDIKNVDPSKGIKFEAIESTSTNVTPSAASSSSSSPSSSSSSATTSSSTSTPSHPPPTHSSSRRTVTAPPQLLSSPRGASSPRTVSSPRLVAQPSSSSSSSSSSSEVHVSFAEDVNLAISPLKPGDGARRLREIGAGKITRSLLNNAHGTPSRDSTSRPDAEIRLQSLFTQPPEGGGGGGGGGSEFSITPRKEMSTKMTNLREIFEKKVPLQTDPLNCKQFHISLSSSEKEKSGSKKSTYLMSIIFTARIDGVDSEPIHWKQHHRLSDWENFHNILGEILSIQFADFPSRKMISSSSSATFEKRRLDLIRFLEGVMYFDDVINSNIFKNFIKFDDHYPPRMSR